MQLSTLVSGPICSLTLLIGWQEGHLASKTTCATYPNGFHIEKMEEKTKGIDWAKVLQPTWHKIDHFEDFFRANLLA